MSKETLSPSETKKETPKHVNALDEKYKYMLGQAHAYQLLLQEISNLLNYKEQKNEQGNVIDIGDKKGNS